MRINELANLLEQALGEKYPALPTGEIKETLRVKIEGKKYDVQDGAIIEAILKNERETLVESFNENIEARLGQLEPEESREEFLGSQRGIDEITDIFISCLEHLIDYFFTGLLSKHFSGS